MQWRRRGAAGQGTYAGFRSACRICWWCMHARPSATCRATRFPLQSRNASPPLIAVADGHNSKCRTHRLPCRPRSATLPPSELHVSAAHLRYQPYSRSGPGSSLWMALFRSLASSSMSTRPSSSASGKGRFAWWALPASSLCSNLPTQYHPQVFMAGTSRHASAAPGSCQWLRQYSCRAAGML